MIVSTTGSADLRTGEHRNLSALMLFAWLQQLHVGPKLQEFKKYIRLLPFQEDIAGAIAGAVSVVPPLEAYAHARLPRSAEIAMRFPMPACALSSLLNLA